MKQDHVLKASDGEKLSVTTYGTIRSDHPRCIVYVHGFKGFKDWGFVPYLGDYLSKRDFFVVTFNFSHNGIGEIPDEFTELDKFADNTFSREVREVSEVIDACCNGFFGTVANPAIGLLGHSRGGGIALLAASKKPEVGSIVTWSSVSHWNRYPDSVKENWRREGYIEITNQRTGQIMKLNKALLDDFEQRGDDYLNIEKAVKNLHKPLLVVHGRDDESVPFAEAEELFHWGNHNMTELLAVPGTGHTFGARHPFEDSGQALESVLKRTAGFFEAHL